MTDASSLSVDLQARITAADRGAFFRDVVRTVLEFSYEGLPDPGTNEGQVVPIQAVGLSQDEILEQLVTGCLEAVRDSQGTLHPPRWLGFDEARVTANLPSSLPKAPFRPLKLLRVHSENVGEDSGFTAHFEFESLAAGH